jgi:glutamate synthase domain-containing protein 1
MCGIVGFLDRRGDTALGATLLKMLDALACRGPDSAGVALFGHEAPGRLLVRLKLGDQGDLDERAKQVSADANPFGAAGFVRTDAYLRFSIAESADVKQFMKAVESIASDVEVVSAGRRLEIVKQVGSPANLENTFHISAAAGRHGIGHTRLSTESIVDLSHSQPFWGHGFPDLAIVHNGHITNYHLLRRRYEQRGVRFYTHNDSEIVGIYLAERLRDGLTLEQALDRMMTDLDGSFSCLVATWNALGFVKDPFSLKPLVFAESDDFVAVATEEIAIRGALPGGYTVREAQAREIKVWERN